MARNEQLIRQHRVLQFLESLRFGATLEEIRSCLIDELGLTSLHQRTVRRDIEALQQAGFDIHSSEADRGRVWKMGESARKGFQLNASVTEVVALSLARDLLLPLAGTPYWQGIESFWSKLMQQLPASIARHYEKHRDTLLVSAAPAKDYSRQLGTLKTIQRGILEHRRVRIQYRAPSKEDAERKIEPYATMLYMSSIYVIAADADIPQDQDRLRHWKLDRILRTDLLDSWFDVPASVTSDLTLTAQSGLFATETAVEYTLRLSPAAAQRVQEDPWTPEQRVELCESGGARLTVTFFHLAELIPRVLSLGDECELLAPEHARRELAHIVRTLAAVYDEELDDDNASQSTGE